MPGRAQPLPFRRPRLTALVLGAASALGFAPLHIWPLTLLCLAMLLALLNAARDRKRALALGYCFGFGQFTIGLNWIAHAFTFQDAMPHWLGWLAVPLLSVYLAVYPAFAAALGWQLGRKGPIRLVLGMAGSWTIFEYLRALVFTGFAWNPLGVIWLDTGVDQLAATVGTYGLGLLALLAAGSIWLIAKGRKRAGAAAMATITLCAMLGLLNAVEVTAPGYVPAYVTVVQPNINQNAKYDPQLEARNFAALARYSGRPNPHHSRLIFWPEAAVPAILDMEPEWRGRLASLLGPGDQLLLGGDKYHFRQSDRGFYRQDDLIGANNSLWVLTARGDLAGRYDKAHLVPFGEYLPMRPILSAIGLSRLVPGTIDFWPGPGPRTLTLPAAPDRHALRMGVQICYEIIFSGQVVDQAHRPDFIFNPSNDAWFGAWGPPQHLAQARLRAIEEAMPIIRSTPTGISAVVNGHGRIVASLPLDTGGAIETQLPGALPPTIFARFGNRLPLALAALACLLAALPLARRADKR